MTQKINIDSLYCLNEDCKDYGQKGANNLSVRKTYGKDNIRYLRCHSCGQEFSERKGTALFNLKIPESKAASVIDHLDAGCGVERTAHLVGVCKETVGRLIRVSGKSAQAIHNVMVRNVETLALEFDEKWSFTVKKQAHLTGTEEEGQAGDRWDINCIDPVSKLLLTLIPGARTAENIRVAVADASSRIAPESPTPAIFTDGEVAYVEAIRETFGRYYPTTRQSKFGPTPAPTIRIPNDLVYAQIIKHRQGGKVKQVEIRPIFGKGKLRQVVKNLGWNKPNTSAIERFNLTDRCRNRRKARRTLSFSRQNHYHDWMSWITTLLYNFHHTQRSLSLQHKCLEHRTPAMAAGLVAHRYSTLELLRICPVGLG